MGNFRTRGLRKSARELLRKWNIIEKEIEKKVKHVGGKQPFPKFLLSEEVAEIFEKWRRGNMTVDAVKTRTV